MNPDLRRILTIQSLDLKVAELEKEIAALPKHIAEIEKQLDTHKKKLEIDKAALAANQRERKKLEDDIKVQDQKISRLKDQMLSAKTNEQYRAFQHEIEYCANEIRKYEDRILDLMAESEPLEAAVKKAEAQLAEQKKQVELEKKSALERSAADQKTVVELRARRAELVAATSAEWINTYEKIRKKTPVAVAEAVDGRCSACQLVLRPQLIQDLRKGTDAILYCEYCKRILYYNPPQSFENDLP
ncbi:MAG: C4-type zinc ribbon domain-containing protein [Bryobacteraceae bacterium]|nr:C4-type zinc ribbon domain-containing protein [Bryobacteraceae bacterium]MDW8379142.1 C4-type zinc ribbon domain-containing protein [Bryobacterales bacterium]